MSLSNTNLPGRVGVLLLCLFALPFAGFGLFALSQAIRLAGAGPGNPAFWYPLIFGLVFSSVGFGLIFVALTGAKRYARQQRLQVEHPSEPWLWRADWAQGRANSKMRTDLIVGWVFAIFWNLISTPITLLVVPAAVKQKGAIACFVLVFPAVGLLLFVYAIRQTIAFFEFGKTYFEMSTLPGVIGRELKGNIDARFPHSPDHGVHLRLSCVHRVTTGSGNSQSTTENIMWRDECDLNSAQLYPGPAGTTIPVAFSIPLAAHPTEKVSPRDEYVWLLEALANVPGVNYHDIFEVPVFRTSQTPAQEEETAAETTFATTSAVTRPEKLTVEVAQSAQGTEFYFPPARNKSFALSVSAFAAFFSGITCFLVLYSRALLVFPLVFGFFSLLLDYISAQLWLGTTRVVIGTSLTLQAGFLGIGRVQEIAFGDIDSISDRITAQMGGGTGTPYYSIELILQNEKKLTLGSTLPDRHEVKWLVSEMRRLAGLHATESHSNASSAVASS